MTPGREKGAEVRRERRLSRRRHLSLTLLLALLVATPGPATRVQPGQRLPPNRSTQGLVYDGLQRDPSGQCRSGFRVGTSDRCTHGPDPAPEGFDIAGTRPPVPAAAALEAVAPRCDGDGASGKRTQVLYVRAADRPDRFATYLTSFQTWAGVAAGIYQRSAAKTGGVRHLRFVHDAGCTITVENVVVPAGADDDIDKTITALDRLGFNRVDRKYMVFMDANVYCGIGDIELDDEPGAENANNGGPSYGRTDAGCWDGKTVAHEHMHNLGGVQLSAPHSSGNHHCVDENDMMCYPDEPDRPPMRLVCPGPADEALFDCNDDDYFNANPAQGSYLATRWNAANNQYLFSDSAPTVSVSDASISEASAGFNAMTFTLRLSSSAGSPVTVDVSTGDGTALAPSDYAATSALVTFPAGTTTQTFQVNVNGDTVPEPNETFSVTLARPVGATTSATPGIGTIVNDDAQPPPEAGFLSTAELSGSDGTVDGTMPKPDATP